MTERLLRRILIFAAGLTVVFLLFRLLSQRSSADGGGLGAGFAALASDSIVAVVMTPPNGDPIRVELSGEPASWRVNDFDVNRTTVARLRERVPQISIVELVASSEQSHPRLGVSSDRAWTIQLKGVKNELTFLLGEVAVKLDHVYARLPDSKDVYEISGELRTLLAVPLADWRSPTVFRVDTARVQEVVLRREDGAFHLTRGATAWSGSITAGEGAGTIDLKPDSVFLSGILLELNNFDAAIDFPRDTAGLGASGVRSIDVLAENGDTLLSAKFVGSAYTWIAQLAGSPLLFKVSPLRLDRLIPQRKQIFRAR